MICGSCSNSLSLIFITGIQIYGCRGACGGLWFNNSELIKLSQQPPSAGQSLLEIEKAEGVRAFRNVEHVCPECKTTLLLRYFFSKDYGFEVDQCSKCGGFWLEFDKIEKNNTAKWERVRKAFAEKISELDTIHPDVLETKQHLEHIARFIFPANA